MGYAMPDASSPTRRSFLVALAALVPAARFSCPSSAWADADGNAFLRTSRIITGTESLSAEVGRRIQGLLSDRVDQFASKLNDLSAAMRATGDSREEMLAGLTDAQVDFALDVARPWYLGYVGSPSAFVLDDDAVFATFLEAQCWEKIVSEVPRITYPGRNAGWWDVAPPNVDAPAMPEQIKSWTFHPGGPSGILAPDPAWKANATADHASIEKARRARPSAGDPSNSN